MFNYREKPLSANLAGLYLEIEILYPLHKFLWAFYVFWYRLAWPPPHCIELHLLQYSALYRVIKLSEIYLQQEIKNEP